MITNVTSEDSGDKVEPVEAVSTRYTSQLAVEVLGLLFTFYFILGRPAEALGEHLLVPFEPLHYLELLIHRL